MLLCCLRLQPVMAWSCSASKRLQVTCASVHAHLTVLYTVHAGGWAGIPLKAGKLLIAPNVQLKEAIHRYAMADRGGKGEGVQNGCGTRVD